ncbi:MAG: MotA/TolQ/ExbB proton channel family protein [bacterium]
MKLKVGSIHGLILGLVAIFGAFFIEGGSVKALFMWPAILIVFGGTFGAVIIGFGSEKFMRIFPLIKMAYSPKKYNAKDLINSMVEIAIKGRKFGLLAAEKDLVKLEHPFSQKMIRLILDGMSIDTIENIAATEMKAMQDRHYSNIFIFTKMGGYAPTMGIIGTVMGLIMTLANAGNDPNILIHNIASAFIATLWGILSANLLWLPVADKLKQCHLEEKHILEVSFEGALAIQSGEIPTVIKSRLMSMLPQKEQAEILAA